MRTAFQAEYSLEPLVRKGKRNPARAGALLREGVVQGRGPGSVGERNPRGAGALSRKGHVRLFEAGALLAASLLLAMGILFSGALLEAAGFASPEFASAEFASAGFASDDSASAEFASEKGGLKAPVSLMRAMAWADDEPVSSSGGVSSQHFEINDDLNNEVNPQQLPDSAFIYEVSLADLATADTFYDGQTVQVVGEVVGDPLNADVFGRWFWISLSSEDGLNTITACMKKSDRDKIDGFGRYGVRGTVLQVHGTFHLVCSEHQGESDIHVSEATVVSESQQMPDEFDASSFALELCVLGVGVVLLLLFYWLRERRR